MMDEYRIQNSGMEDLCHCFHCNEKQLWQVMKDWKQNVTLIVEDSCQNAEVLNNLAEIQQKNAYIYVIRGSKLF